MTIALWDIAILLLGAKIGGSIFNRFQQPSLIGELLAGVILGSILGWVTNIETIEIVANLGLMFLILLTMMSIDLSKIDKEIEKLVAAQAITAALIFVLIFLAMKIISADFNIVILAFAAVFGSSTAISARTLMSMNVMNSKEGQAIIGLQIINGIIELLIISATINMFQYHQLDIEPLAKLALMIIGTFAVMSRMGTGFINWVFNYAQKFKMEEVLLALTLVMAFTAAGFAEKAGMSSFLGVMLVGMLISRSQQAITIRQKTKELGESFFIPIFFASLGLGVSLSGIAGDIGLLVTLLFVFTAIRFAAFTIPMLLIDYSFIESIKIASGLISMSEYGLWALSLGITYSVIDNHMYSIFVIIFLIVNIFSPFIVKALFKLNNFYRKSWSKPQHFQNNGKAF